MPSSFSSNRGQPRTSCKRARAVKTSPMPQTPHPTPDGSTPWRNGPARPTRPPAWSKIIMIPIPVSAIPKARTISLLRRLPVNTSGSASLAKPMSPCRRALRPSYVNRAGCPKREYGGTPGRLRGGGLRGAGFRLRLIIGNSRGSPHEIRRVDVLHRLLDGAGGARGCARGARLRHCLGARAFAHPGIAQIELYSGERAAQALLRRHGPVCDADRCRDGDQDVEGRNRRLSCRTAGSDPDRQAGRLDRPRLGRALRLRGGKWLERGRDGEPRDRLRHSPQAREREHRGNEGNLDQVGARISRRVRELRSDDGLAQARAEAVPLDPGGRGISLLGAARHPLWRWLDAAGYGKKPDAADRAHSQVPADVRRSQP